MVAGKRMPLEEDSVPVEDSIPADGLRLDREINDVVDIARGVDDESVSPHSIVDEWIKAVGGMNLANNWSSEHFTHHPATAEWRPGIHKGSRPLLTARATMNRRSDKRFIYRTTSGLTSSTRRMCLSALRHTVRQTVQRRVERTRLRVLTQ